MNAIVTPTSELGATDGGTPAKKSIVTAIFHSAAITVAAGAAFLASFAGSAVAQDNYPSRPITLIVGSSPGGGGDTVARAVADKLSPIIGQPIVVDNRPGASGNIAEELVAKANPDGYTILLAYTGHVINPGLFSSLPFDPVNDFKPIIMLATNTTVLLVPANSPVKSVADLVATAKEKPGSLNMGTMLGSSQHLAGELFASMSDIEFEVIPYKGNGVAIQDLLGGRLDFMFNTLEASRSALESGTARAIAVTGAERSANLPDVPTIQESGIEGFATSGWYGFLAPANTPDPIVQKLYEATKQALESPDLTQIFQRMGNDVAGTNPADFDSFIRAEIPRWSTLIDEIGLEKQ